MKIPAEEIDAGQYEAYLRLLKFRRSIRGFRGEPVARELIVKILEAARWAPSAGNSQPWEFVVVEDRNTIAELAKLYEQQTMEKKQLEATRVRELRVYSGEPAAEGRAPFRDAHCIIFILTDERWGNAFPLRTWLDKGHRHIISSVANAVFAMHCAAAALGLATQWVSDFGSPWLAGMTKHLLQIPGHYDVYEAMPVGYPTYYPKPRYVKPLDEIVHYDKFDVKRDRTEQQICEYIIAHMRPGLKVTI